MKLYPLLFFVLGLVITLPSVAQETPRDFVIAQLSAHNPNPASIVALPLAKPTAPVSESPVIPKETASVLLPFYTSVRDYVAARGAPKRPQAVFKYTVNTAKLDQDAKPTEKHVTVTLGVDYAAIASEQTTKIYDFKQNRLLTLRPEHDEKGAPTGALLFDNVSLYSRVFRNIKTVRSATQNGALSTIPMGGGKTLDAFWIESAMSWAVNARFNPMDITYSDNRMQVVRKNQRIFSARFVTYDAEASALYQKHFKSSFLKLAHYEWPLAPNVLRAVADHQLMPLQHMEIVSYGPRALGGEKQIWDMTEHFVRVERFALPGNALSVVERRPVAPLAFVINQAVQGKALGGRPTHESMLQSFYDNKAAGKPLKAWLAGQKYMSYIGSCDEGENICAHIAAFEQAQLAEVKTTEQSTILQNYIKGFEQTKRPATRAAGVVTLKPYLKEKTVPAIVLRTAAMARANLKPVLAKMSGLGSVRAGGILEQALAKDPYDPNTYLGLAQVFAANGAYEQSWDIYDALRAGIAAPKALTLKIDAVERNLVKTVPGYFSPN